jgi:hypothetical protein
MKTDIAKAICRLDATQVSPRRWEYYAEETRETYRLTRGDLEALAELLADDDVVDPYSHWCAGRYGRLVRGGR